MKSWKYLWFDIALYAVFTEFHVLGILFRVMSVGKKDSGILFWSCLLFTNSLENKLLSAMGAYWYFIECIIFEVLNIIWSVNFSTFRFKKKISVCSLYLAAAIFLIDFFCIFSYFFCFLAPEYPHMLNPYSIERLSRNCRSLA